MFASIHEGLTVYKKRLREYWDFVYTQTEGKPENLSSSFNMYLQQQADIRYRVLSGMPEALGLTEEEVEECRREADTAAASNWRRQQSP